MTTPTQRNAIGGRWRSRLLRLLSDAASAVVDDQVSVGDRIHYVRRLAKEGRALLKLAPPTLAEAARAQRAALRPLRQTFGAARDARVSLALAEKRKPRSKAERSAAGFLRTKLGAVCALEEAALTPQKLEATADSLTAIAQTIAGWRLPRHADPLFRDRLARAYRTARRLTPADDEADFAALHALRSAVVDHLYQLGLLARRDAGMARRVRTLHKLREDLGDYLDHLCLQQAALELAADSRTAPPPTSAKRHARAMKAARRLFADKHSTFRAKLGD